MPDAMDAIQREAERIVDVGLQRHANRSRAEGRSTCAHADCGEPIAPERTALGARLCIDCQRGEEAAASHFATWRQPR